eukprot:1770385-Rhodomonas_salina.3
MRLAVPGHALSDGSACAAVQSPYLIRPGTGHRIAGARAGTQGQYETSHSRCGSAMRDVSSYVSTGHCVAEAKADRDAGRVHPVVGRLLLTA